MSDVQRSLLAFLRRDKLRFSWAWSLDHDWRIWIDRTPLNCTNDFTFKWRFNIGPLHIVRFL